MLDVGIVGNWQVFFGLCVVQCDFGYVGVELCYVLQFFFQLQVGGYQDLVVVVVVCVDFVVGIVEVFGKVCFDG